MPPGFPSMETTVHRDCVSAFMCFIHIHLAKLTSKKIIPFIGIVLFCFFLVKKTRKREKKKALRLNS